MLIACLRLNQLTGQQEVVLLNNHVLSVALLGGTGNLYKYNDGITFIPEPNSLMLLVSGLLFVVPFFRKAGRRERHTTSISETGL